MKPYPLLFMGSPAVAVTILKGLLEAGHEIRAVITQPDKPAGRGQHLHPPPVKEFAGAQSIPVLQPRTLKDPALWESLKPMAPQAIVVAAYGKLIPHEILEMSPWGCLNVHFSLLPKYRGASCVASAIVNGEKESGVTIMRITEKLDAGPILLQEKVAIGPEETTGELEERLGALGSDMMIKALEGLERGELRAQDQDESRMTYAPLIKKEEGRIDWQQPAQKIHDQIRAFNPWPVAFTYIDKIRVKVYGSRIALGEVGGRRQEVGGAKILNLSESGIEVSCGEGQLLLTDLQPESKRRMTAWDFIQGHRAHIQKGKQFE